jgi:hypothetical protein
MPRKEIARLRGLVPSAALDLQDAGRDRKLRVQAPTPRRLLTMSGLVRVPRRRNVARAGQWSGYHLLAVGRSDRTAWLRTVIEIGWNNYGR